MCAQERGGILLTIVDDVGANLTEFHDVLRKATKDKMETEYRGVLHERERRQLRQRCVSLSARERKCVFGWLPLSVRLGAMGIGQ